MPFFSIVIPVFNAEKTIRDTIDHLYNNKTRDFEVIAVDDGSTDNSYSILKTYADLYDNLTVINKNNGGVSSVLAPDYINHFAPS